MDTQYTLQSAVNFPVALQIDAPTFAYQGKVSTQPFTIRLSAEDFYPYTVGLYSRGSASAPYQLPRNKWSQLIPQWRFTDLSGNYIDSITLSDMTASVVGGTTGMVASAQCYYIDDMPTVTPLDLIFTVDFSNNPVWMDQKLVKGYSNSNVATSASFAISALAPAKINITKNGTTALDSVYWKNIDIPYVVTLCSDDGVTLFNIPSSNALGTVFGSFSRGLSGISSSVQTWTPAITSSFNLSATNEFGHVCGGVATGYVRSDIATDSTAITAGYNLYFNTSSIYVTGQSVDFAIQDFNKYDIRRFDESWDAVAAMQQFARATHIHDNPVMWNQYMQGVLGSPDSEQGKAFGRQAYERIANFNDNHSDVNVCNVSQLYSLAAITDVPIDNYNLEYPESLQRIMDIISINQQLLWGSRCKCNLNLTNEYQTQVSASSAGFIRIPVDTLCDRCSHYHSGNRGTIFNPISYMVSAYVPFVVKNTLENNYTVLSPSIISGSSVYPLSAHYNIILPNVIDYSPIPTYNEFITALNYFCFYEYVDTFCDVQVAGVINWSDEHTTLNEKVSTSEEWYVDNGVIDRMLNYVLHKGLNLID